MMKRLHGSQVPITIIEAGLRQVCLIGVDTPKTVHPTKAVQPYGKEASAFTKSQLTPGKQVWLEYDVQPRDKYARLLAYVWTTQPTMDPPSSQTCVPPCSTPSCSSKATPR